MALGERVPFEIMYFHHIKKNEEYGITFGILFSLLVQYSWNTSISIKSVDITSVCFLMVFHTEHPALVSSLQKARTRKI